MTTSYGGSPSPTSAQAPPGPARLRMAAREGPHRLDGGWWPHSRDLSSELGQMLAELPPDWGRVVRALFSPPDWDPAPRRVPVGAGYLKVGSFPADDTHLMLLTTSERRILRILVVPPGFTRAQGEEALLAASTWGNAHSAGELLDEVLAHPDVDSMDLWVDDGGS